MMNKTWKIIIKGMVQGIGYRPFVAETAEKHGLKGNVINAGGSVIITATAEERVLKSYAEFLRVNYPDGAAVMDIICEEQELINFDGFIIKESESLTGLSWVPQIPPDIPVCKRCILEMRDPVNRRYRYPFISCASCGPRYSIIDSLPYDRENTAMIDFDMCETCRAEYTKPGGIRRHAQTISCRDCGPQLHFELAAGYEAKGEEAVAGGVDLINSGGIAAVKDIGGYHLACMPWNEDTVSELRYIKNREKKPFAMMFPDVEAVRQFCQVDKEEEKLLTSAARPIVLLLKKDKIHSDRIISENVCGDSPYIGAMLPCNPMQILLMDKCGPLIMTSANVSGMPIIIDDDEMRRWIIDKTSAVNLCMLWNERDIRIPLDDSVMKIVDGRQQIFRRARGLVPLPVKMEMPNDICIFAAGGDLKASFCFAKDGAAYTSQYLGDLEEAEAMELYRMNYGRFKALFGFEPDLYCADRHPLYKSVRETADIAGDAKQLQFQHHKAHVASVIAEHGISGRIIGVAFDGTGYGDDGNVWGSEFFLCDGGRGQGSYLHKGHLKPIDMIGGDEGMRNCRAMHYSFMHAADMDAGDCSDALTVYAALDRGINTIVSSSMGRLFDAASSAIGVCDYNDYEGEAAIELENLAVRAYKPYPLELAVEETEGMLNGNGPALIRDIDDAVKSGAEKKDIALGFHLAVSGFVAEVCKKIRDESNASKVALSGGTFQNRILLIESRRLLEEAGFEVYTNERVSPGDGGICLGQAYLAAMGEK